MKGSGFRTPNHNIARPRIPANEDGILPKSGLSNSPKTPHRGRPLRLPLGGRLPHALRHPEQCGFCYGHQQVLRQRLLHRFCFHARHLVRHGQGTHRGQALQGRCFFPFPSIFDLVWNKLVATVWTTEPKNGKLVIERMHKFWHEILDPKYLMRTCFVALGRLRRLVGSGAIFPSLLAWARETRSRGMKETQGSKLKYRPTPSSPS